MELTLATRQTAPSERELILRAQAGHYRILKSSNTEARELLEQARALEADNARVHSLLGAVLLLVARVRPHDLMNAARQVRALGSAPEASPAERIP